MTTKKIPFLVLLLFIIFTACTKHQTPTALQRSVPETEGVSSEGIISFLDAAAKSKHEFHSFMFLRHGKVIAEGWWNPYRPDLRHTLYSTSKSFTSTAVGLAVSEKRLTVNDNVISFFPENLPDTISPFLSELKVKDLLSMSVGHGTDPTFDVITKDSNWVKAFLSLPIVNEPGTKFLYNTLATYTLSAIVQKVTGEKVLDYLTPRLFEPLEIQGIDWEMDLMGINTGGWGLRLKTEDMAKFGQLYLQKGKWNEIQVLPAAWIEEATTFKIDQAPDMPREEKDLSDWTQGYCYQFWRCRHNGFRADGAYGQYIIVLPDLDAVIAITAETDDMQDEINLVWNFLLPAMHPEKLPENKEMVKTLKQKLSSLALPLPVTGTDSSVAKSISGKTYVLKPNEKNIKSIFFRFDEDKCQVKVKIDTASYDLSFGSGTWQDSETNKPAPGLLSSALVDNTCLLPYRIAGSYTWKESSTLELVLRYIESPHTETIICRFVQDSINIEMQVSQSFGSQKTLLTGKREK